MMLRGLGSPLPPGVVSYLAMAAREREKPPRVPDSSFPPSGKKLFEKKVRKKFGGYGKVPYLCIRFPKETEGLKRKIVL